MLSQNLRAAMNWERYKADPIMWIDAFGLLRDKQGKPCELDANQRPIFDPQNKRIIINCHRQWGKSTICSLLCFHRALFYPKSLCLLVAPSLRQSSENFRKIADGLDILTPPPELEEDTKLSLKFVNGSRIISLPGSQKTIRGFTAPDLIVIDEAGQAEDDLYGALFPMLSSNPAGRLILASTPWGRRGFFFELWERGLGWLKIKVVAADNPRISPAVLEEARVGPNGPLWFAQEYCGEFVTDEFSLFDDARINKALSDDFEEIDAEVY